jgi:phosphohistidine phosphatase
MELYILRHGIAHDRSHGLVDAERELTEKGRKRLRKLARAMREMGLKYDLILTSPYARALQTAAIVAKVLDLADRLELSPLLEPGTSPRLLIDHLAQRQGNAPVVLVVGHEPMLSTVISLLVCGTPEADFSLRKGGLCKLSAGKLRYARCASLEWLLTPKQLPAGSA